MPELGGRRSPELGGPFTLLIPLGSTEQHGPHLPLDTDTRIAFAIARRVAGQREDVMVAPALAYGASGEHAGFAGTMSIGTDALRLVLVELVRSLGSEVARTVLVNGHGGNHQAVTEAVTQLRGERRAVTSWSPRVSGGDAHAGRTETALLLAIAPELVHLHAAAPGNQRPLDELLPELRRRGVQAVSPNGVLGDPRGATAAHGRETLTALAADLVALLDDQNGDA